MRAHPLDADSLAQALKSGVILKIRGNGLFDGKEHACQMQARAHPTQEQRAHIANDDVEVCFITNDVVSPTALVPGNPSEALAIHAKMHIAPTRDSEAKYCTPKHANTGRDVLGDMVNDVERLRAKRHAPQMRPRAQIKGIARP